MPNEEIEKQRELFEEFKKPDTNLRFFKDNKRFFQNRILALQFSIEKLIFLLLGIIILIIFTFCLGVELGKRIIYPAKNMAHLLSVPAKFAKQAGNLETLSIKPAVKLPVQENIQMKSPLISMPSKKQASGSIYAIRVASYANKISAEGIVAKIRKTGLPAYLVKSGKLFAICVGDYSDKKQAESVLLSLRKKYKDSYIKMIRK